MISSKGDGGKHSCLLRSKKLFTLEAAEGVVVRLTWSKNDEGGGKKCKERRGSPCLAGVLGDSI